MYKNIMGVTFIMSSIPSIHFKNKDDGDDDRKKRNIFFLN